MSGSRINELSSLDTISSGDLLPVWNTSNGDTRKVSFSTVADFVKAQGELDILNTYSDLKAVTPTALKVYQILGGDTVNDQKGGFYYWDANSVATPDDYLIIQSDTTSTGRWIRLYMANWGSIGGDINTQTDLQGLFLSPADIVDNLSSTDTDKCLSANQGKQLQDTKISEILDDTTPQLGGVLDTNSNAVRLSKGTDIASAAALTLGADGNYFDITGTTTITSINTTGNIGTVIKLHFDDSLTLTHNATSLILPSGANITTSAGDEAEFIEYSSGNFRCINYSKVDGTSLIGGKVLQVVETRDGSTSAGTTNIPLDDTIPQITEGDEFMSLSVTPIRSDSKLKIDVVFNGDINSNLAVVCVALFRDSISDAVGCTFASTDTQNNFNVSFSVIVDANSTSLTTFKVRAGTNAGYTTRINGRAGARLFGGTVASSITITEIGA